MSDMFAGSPVCYTDDEAVQRALISEHAADATYRNIMLLTKDNKVREIVEEIMRDEQNHQGKLQGLLIELRGGEGGGYNEQFCAGLVNTEGPLP